jgi:glycosyltransferase involved in cell wall biosynthesis
VAFELSILIPTLGRPELLRRVLDRLDAQTAPAGSFEVVVVADAKERDLEAVDRVVAGRRHAVRRLQAPRPGASAARNEAWRAAASDVVLFLDDDILPEPPLVAEHIAWHRRHPQEEVGVLGHVRWADELRVTPFMRWLEDGIQFDYPNIAGTEAGWGRFYTANASVKRALVERAGGFEEERLPFGYEDLDLALRMHEHGFRLLYCRTAVAEHVHPMDIEFYKRRVARIAISERAFVRMHPEIAPYFFEMFSAAAADKPAKGLGARLAGVVPRSLPVLGPRVWASADAVYKQALARPFLDAWHAQEQEPQGPAGEVPA